MSQSAGPLCDTSSGAYCYISRPDFNICEPTAAIASRFLDSVYKNSRHFELIRIACMIKVRRIKDGEQRVFVVLVNLCRLVRCWSCFLAALRGSFLEISSANTVNGFTNSLTGESFLRRPCLNQQVSEKTQPQSV